MQQQQQKIDSNEMKTQNKLFCTKCNFVKKK